MEKITTISGHTRLVGLFATPIRHSFSPLIHNTAFQLLGIDAAYLAFEVGNDTLPQAIDSIRTLEMLGANLSMPNKTLALDFMDEVSPAGQLIGAINTIVNQEGRLIGHNTDGIGFMQSLAANQVVMTGEKMTVIGAGGAATAIIVQAALDGVAQIDVYNRRDAFFDTMAVKLAEIAQQTKCHIQLHDLAEEATLQQTIAASRLVVNATGVGMKPLEGQSPLKDFSAITKNHTVYDVIYNPRETQFLKHAKAQGAQTLNGLGMLLYQGAAAFEKWTGQPMPVEKIAPLLDTI